MNDLRERRVQAGMTQVELARRSGVAQPNIAAYELGRRRPSKATMEKLSAALRPRASESLARHRDEVVRVLERYGMTNPRVFGSVADARDGRGSDLDLLVDVTPELDLLDIIDAAAELEALLEVRVDLVASRSLTGDHEILRTAVPV